MSILLPPQLVLPTQCLKLKRSRRKSTLTIQQYVVCVVLVILLTPLTSRPSALAEYIPRLNTSVNLPKVIGLKAEGWRASVDIDGNNVIQAEMTIILRLFGDKLTNRTSVTFTTHPSHRGSLCNDFSRTEPYVVNLVEDKVGVVTMTLPVGTYFICTKIGDDSDQRDWHHMGTAPWLTIKAEGKFLPFSLQIVLIFTLLALSGLFSGLNLGLMALDQNELKVIASCGTEEEKRFARAIQPVRSRGNYLLCSLLLGNVLVNSSLTILLDELTSGLVAVLASTISIVIFGEIIPQAICSRHGLAVGAKTIWVPYLFMAATFPLSWPISKILDYILGDEIGNVYDRERLMEYIRITKDYNKLEIEEVNIISGALGLKKKMVGEIMTRLEDVFMLGINTALDFQAVSEIQRRGYSRIPVYDNERKNIVALFHAKDLAFVDPEDAIPLKTVIDFYGHQLIHTYEDTTLDIVLQDFKQGKSHMAFVRQIYDTGEGDPYYEVTGVVTLEDVIEEILQTEIVDETDIISDNRKKQRRKAHLRQDFSDFAKIGEGEQGINIISPQMALATFQFLCTSVDPFSRKFISEAVLRRLLTQRIYYQCKVEESQMSDGKYSSLGSTNYRVLYLAGKPVDYFIMILEGRVSVTVGKENLIFESGPFSHFGLCALAAPSPGEGITGMSKASSRHSVSSTYIAIDKDVKERPVSPEGIRKSPSTLSKHNQQELPATNISGSSISTACFVPDYTVKVMESTLYLKIPRRVYLAAYRATLMERQKDSLNNDHDDDNRGHDDNSELESVIRSFREGSIQEGINRQRSYPALNHRESIVSSSVSTKQRKRSIESHRLSSTYHPQRAASQAANNGGLLHSNSEETRDDNETTKFLFSGSPSSPSPSLDDGRHIYRDNAPSPTLSLKEIITEKSHLV